MKLYISDKDKLTKFKLPVKIDESFLFIYSHDTNKIDYQINISSSNGKWCFMNDSSIYVEQQPTTILEDYYSHTLTFKDLNDDTHIFTLPDNDNTTRRLTFTEPNLIIGSDPSCNIVYKDSLTLPQHASIVKKDDEFYITAAKDDNARIYLNNKRIHSEKLQTGDIIFINGLKIIWMKDFIKINNPLNKVGLNGNLFDCKDSIEQNNSQFTKSQVDDENIELYKDDEYFFHRPRLKTIIEKQKIKIDPPPENQNKEDIPLVFELTTGLTMILTSSLSAFKAYSDYKAGTKTMNDVLPTFLLCGCMLIFSFILPRIFKILNRRRKVKREKLRQEKYSKYLKGKEDEINLILKNQTQILNENYISLQECANIVMNNKRKIWEREITDSDFLEIRLGVGNRDAEITYDAPEKSFTLDEDNLFNDVYDLVDRSKELKNVPITFNYIENKVSAILTESSFNDEFINGVILQLITYHSGNDLKLVFLTSKENEQKWNYLKELPHNWNSDKSVRYFATNLEEMKLVINELEKEFQTRRAFQNDNASVDQNGEKILETDVYKNFNSYFLIITDNYKIAKQIDFINTILTIKENYGFSLLLLESSMQNLPNVCNRYTYVMDTTSCVFEKELAASKQLNFTADHNPSINMREIAREIANIPIISSEGAHGLPNTISFLEMYKVGKIEQLNILNRWKTSNPIASLQTPIGVQENGDLFKLDLHEKFHGPHGLIAGTTGSGKSEFIITYLLSLAVNYHPYEVQFVLIDYKGGGLAGAFENRETGLCIPHLTGTITNLDTSEMNRTLVSIESELKRRQTKFNEVRDSLGESTIDIYKYQRLYREGVIKEPISHLFIVSDEFAELKSQQPEFLQQLISTARIGRSLGVHLILATQKPSGVVNDQIWSNSKFKVCLKVQTRQDSMEMIKRPEASLIKEAGRFYLQVGADELFELGQSAWAGAKYQPTDKITKKIDDSISFIDNTGFVIKSTNDIVKKENVENNGEQLTNIVKYLAAIAEKENIVCKKLWLESIPENIYITNLKQKYKHTAEPYIINPIIGECDNPSKQKQDVLKLNLSDDTNTLVYGQTGSGKENFITTAIVSTAIEHRPEEINFYILDFGAETLKKFQEMPHVGEVLFGDEGEKIHNFLNMLTGEINRRKELFAEYSGNYRTYIENSNEKLPQITTFINSFEVFIEQYPRLEDKILTLLRDGPKFGINFLVTTSVYNGVKIRLTQYFTHKYVLQMAQTQDYRSLLSAPRNLFPAKYFGRGLTNTVDESILEFQTAYICDPANTTKTIKDIIEKLKAGYNYKARKVPIMPKVVLGEEFKDEPQTLEKVSLGIRNSNLQTMHHNFTKPNVTLILANSLDDAKGFTNCLLDELTRITDLTVTLIDFKKNLKDIVNEKTNYHNENFQLILNDIKQKVTADANNNMYVFSGIGEYKLLFNEDDKKLINEVLGLFKNKEKSFAIIMDEYNSYKNVEIEPWVRLVIDKNEGIWLGDGFGSQISMKAPNMTLDEKKVSFPYMAYSIVKTKHTLFKHMTDKEEEEENEE